MKNNQRGSLSIETALSMTTFFMAVFVLLMILKGIGTEDDIEQMLYDQSCQIAILDIQRSGELAVLTSAMTFMNVEKNHIGGTVLVTEADLKTDGTFSYSVVWKRKMPLVGMVSKTFKSTNRLLTRGADGIRNQCDELVYITRTGKKYHASGCIHLKESEVAISKENALTAGYEPCWHCIGGLAPFEKAPSAPN